MENCLSKNPDINVVYTINEPAANGAYAALEAAGAAGVLIVSVDGGCAGVQLSPTAHRRHRAAVPASTWRPLGVEAIRHIVEGGEKPAVTDGLDFFNTGVALVTDKPVDGLDSIDTTEAAEICWG